MRQIKCFLLLMFFVPMLLSAQEEYDPYDGYNEETFMDMDFEPNILSPEVPNEALKSVQKYVRKVANDMQKQFTVDLFRDDDVIIVTLPSDDIFLPNDTLLSPYSREPLNNLLKYMSDPDMFKIIVTVHTDNTGSETYREDLSTARLNSLYDYMMNKIDEGVISEDLIIIPFSFASYMPITDNNTRKSRAQNRRVEFYFVPGPKLISQAINNKLK